MARRGRPPYPDLLTPREWEVLALLREGRSNEEIAERLGVSLAGAKYHVSEILGKLGVESREEAARWEPDARSWWLAAFAPIASLRSRLGWAPQVAIATAVVALAAGAGLLLWGLLRTNGDDRSPASSICVPGQIGNLFVDVQDAGPESFAGPASSTLNKPTGETILVRVDKNTQWRGNVQSMSDVQNGMELGITLQAAGPYQSNCSLLAANVFSNGKVVHTEEATPTVVEPTPGVPIGQTTVLATGNAGGLDWSPDGQSIAYSLDGRVYRADAPDFSPRLLATPGEELLGAYGPRWSPDGTRIAFLGRYPWSIWLIDSDGSGLRDLLPSAAANLALRGPTLGQWLDDHTLVFYDGCGTACRQPYLLDTLTSKVTRGVRVPDITTGLVGSGILGTAYYWSPDKRWIAAPYAERANPIALYDRENQSLVRLPGPPAGFNQGLWQWFDSWAPDSRRFLYEQLNPNSTAASTLPPSLHIYDIATGEDRTLVEAGSSGSWSSDGRFIAYTAPAVPDRPCGSSDAETACVAVVQVASGHEVYRVPGPGAFGGGDSSPHTFLLDGRLIYRGYNARELRVASNGQSEVLANVNGMREFKVSPDGRYVVTSEPGVTGRVILVAIPP